MRRYTRRLLQVLLVAWPVVATAQSTPVEGRVVMDGDASPLQGATVAWSAGKKLVTVLTDERGAFSVPPSQPMPQRVAVTRAGFVTQMASLGATGNGIEVRLSRAAIGVGMVRDADGLPVTNVGVRLQQSGPRGDGPSWTLTTDDRGEFRTLELPQGQYRVYTIGRLTIDGAVIWQALSDAATVNLTGGETTLITLTHRVPAEPARTSERGAITGVVLDAAGLPAAGVTVRVFRGSRCGTSRCLSPAAAPRTTDDAGRYRLFDLEPGSYVVQAADERPFIAALDADVDVPVYYPSTVAAPDAVQLRLPAGRELGGIDIRLRRDPYVKVSGTIVPTGATVPSRISLRRREVPGAFLEPALSAEVSTGAFTFPRVPPGDYLVQTQYQIPEPFPFVLTVASDLDGVVVRTGLPRAIAGRIEFEGNVPNPSQFSLAFLPADPELTGDTTSVLGMVFVTADRAFHVTAPSGIGRFVMRRAPQGWFVKAVRDGTTRPGYEPFDPGDGAGLTIVLARATGVIEGTVRGGAEPGQRRHVVAFSTDERLWFDRSPYLAAVAADDSGHFVMPRLPAGDYEIVAVDAADIDIAGGDLEEPWLLREWTRDRLAVSVRDGTRQQVTVSVSRLR
jgi:hypothetical protein